MKPGYITRVRTTMGMNFQQFAAHIGASGQAVSRWEAGTAKPQARFTVRIKAVNKVLRTNAQAQAQEQPPLPVIQEETKAEPSPAISEEGLGLIRDFSRLAVAERPIISRIIGNL